MSAQDLVTQWQAEAATLRDLAETHRKSGMYELARGERLKADSLIDCATQLQATLPAPVTPTTVELSAGSAASASSPHCLSAVFPAGAAETQGATAAYDALLLLQEILLRVLSEGCSTAALEGWDSAGLASDASVTKGLPPPPELLRLLGLQAAPSPHPSGSTGESEAAGSPPPQPRSSSFHSSPDSDEGTEPPSTAN